MLDRPGPKPKNVTLDSLRMTKKDRFKFGDKYKCDKQNIVLKPLFFLVIFSYELFHNNFIILSLRCVILLIPLKRIIVKGITLLTR